MRSKPRIVVIGGTPPPYHGVTVYTEYLLQSELRESFDLVHVDTSDHRDIDNLSCLDVVNVAVAFKNLLVLVWALCVRRPDIVYLPISAAPLPYLRDGVFILCAKLISSARVVIHLHGGFFFREQFLANSSSPYRGFIKATLRRVDLAIVLGQSLKSVFDGLVKTVVVVPNGSLFEPDLNELQAQRGRSDVIRVGFLGNLIRAKGFLDALASAMYVVGRAPNVLFRFAGPWWAQEPESRSLTMKFIQENNLHHHVEFVGPVTGEEKKTFFAKTDIFLFPSQNEGFPLVILKAMASSCPVISTRGVGAISEVVEDGVTGLLVDKRDVDGIADAVVRLINDPELRQSMGNAGRRKYEEEYMMDKNIRKMSGIFSTLLSPDGCKVS